MIVVKFKLERETTGAFRYQEVDDNGNPLQLTGGALIGTLYLRKSEMPARWTELEVSVKGNI